MGLVTVHLNPSVRVVAVAGVSSISVIAIIFTGVWALPLALLGMCFIRPSRSKGKRKEED